MRRRSERWWLGISLAALVVTGAGTAYASSIGADAVSALVGGPATVQSAVLGGGQNFSAVRATGSAPGPAAEFASGETTAWTVSGDNLGLSDTPSYVAGTAQTWVVSGSDLAGERTLIGLDAATGKKEWRLSIGSGTDAALTCAPEMLGNSVFCAYGGSAPDSSTGTVIDAVDILTGKISKTADLSALGLTGRGTVDQIHVFNNSVVIRRIVGTAEGSKSGTVSRIPEDLSSVTWTTVFPALCEGGEGWPSVARQSGRLLVLSDAEADTAFDFASGDLIANPRCVPLDTYGASGIAAGDGTDLSGPDTTKQLRDGSVVNIVSAADAGANAASVSFAFSARPSPVPLFEAVDASISAGADSPSSARAVAFAPGAKPLWETAVFGTSVGMRGAFHGAWDGKHLILVDSVGKVSSVDPETGRILWATNYGAPLRGTTEAGATEPDPMFAADGTLVVSDADSSDGGSGEPFAVAFDPRTGAQLWRKDRVDVAAMARVGDQSSVAFWSGTGSGRVLGAMVPSGAQSADSGAASPASAGLPACPVGMSAVSWSIFPGGHLLLCGNSRTYVVDYTSSGRVVPCSSLGFSQQGFILTCSGHETVSVLGGGAILQMVSPSRDLTQPADHAWSAWAGPTAFGSQSASAAVDQSCPPRSTLLSLSVWNGGWLLICGTDAMTVTSFTVHDGTTSSSGHSMTLSGDRYCGKTDAGVEVCASASPALVTFTPPGATAAQHPTSSNYFVTKGVGGAGVGGGAYGVQAPSDTAADQVRYIVQILQKSEVGRAQVSSLVPDLLRCSATADDVSKASAVIANRQQLLSALQSTPSEQVPSGTRLIAELTNALTVSLQADQGYLDAARQMASGDCPNGMIAAQNAVGVANQTDALKQTFVADWNANIAGHYPDAATFSADTI